MGRRPRAGGGINQVNRMRIAGAFTRGSTTGRGLKDWLGVKRPATGRGCVAPELATPMARHWPGRWPTNVRVASYRGAAYEQPGAGTTGDAG